MAAVMLMTMPSRSLMLPEPSAGITRIGTTIANCSQAARHGMPSSLSSTSLPPKMPLGISEKKILPVLTIVTDNGGPFRSFTFEAFIATRPELRHVRTLVRTPGQNGSRERGFGTMKYEWLFREEINDGLQLVEHVNAYRHDYNHVRPHEAIAWNRPADVYAGTADPTVPNFETKEILPTT